MKISRAILASTILAILPTATFAAVVTPGNLVIYRVGDGTAGLNNTATAVFLDEYTTSGALVQSIAVPFTGAGALTAVGNATTEGIISQSQDGTALLFTGYRKNAGGANPSGDTYAVTNRVVGALTLAGTPDTNTALTNDGGGTAANTIRSATSASSTNGSALWISTSSRVSYNSSGIGNSGGTTQIDARNSRQVNLSGNMLYASNGSTTIVNKVQSYGTLPTSTTAPTAVVALGTADAVNGFFLADLDVGVAGSDTLYALSTVANQLLKYTFNGTAWSASGSLTLSGAGNGAQNLVGVANGGNVSLYLTSGTTLSKLTDASGYGGTLAGSFTTLASAGNNTAFRGIGAFAAVPEPAAVAFGTLVCGLVGVTAVARQFLAKMPPHNSEN